MKNIIKIVFVILLFSSCKTEVEHRIVKSIDLEGRKVEMPNFDELVQGKSYLPVYSHIYHRYEDRTFDLTITVSIRNITTTDSIYILKADYFNTDGDNIRQYIQEPICLKPLETVEIVIAEEDKEGGSGANFVFDWAVKNDKNPPLFEAVMISTNGQQGLSFSTRGLQIFEK
ncbi:MAG: DUF3124 domain-containing protein [Bacteroidales bacterium]|nr:DUF3124 domain-containing protein [Bacteroidales bacterium]MDD4216952.1 DUF3124 domain-containing protein [Bacteroidales bacterium]MDY0140741.1 DUF3124 domain-containing protein [Bacteroidales bacterium]